MNTSTIVQIFWNHCNVLRDDGMCYGDEPFYHDHHAFQAVGIEKSPKKGFQLDG